MNPYICNVKKSPRDRRDYYYASSSERPAIPDKIDYRSDLQQIRDQGSQGSCYAQATACMKEWQEKKDNGFNEYMSPQFFYNNRPNKYDIDPTNDDGMFGRDVMKILTDVGICRESVYRYGRIEPKSKIPQNVYDEAKRYRIKSYAQVDNLVTLKECLCKNGPCLITFPVYNYGPRFWKKPSLFTSKTGGHAVAIVGYTEDGFIIRNSWGSDWGDSGYTIYPYTDWGAHWEIWTTIDLENTDIYVPTSCWEKIIGRK